MDSYIFYINNKFVLFRNWWELFNANSYYICIKKIPNTLILLNINVEIPNYDKTKRNYRCKLR